MKKILLALLALVLLAGGGFLIRQNLPEKRYARHIVKARLFVREKNYTAARLEYEQAFNAKDGFSPYANLEVLKFTNMVNLQENHIAEAITNTRKYLEKSPDKVEGNIILSQLAFNAGDFGTAFDAIHIALDLDPKSFPARLLLTEVRTKQGRLDLAEEQLRYLYQAYPESVMAVLPLAENMLRQGRVEEGRAFVQAALKTSPNNASARVMLLDSYLLEGKADSARGVLAEWQTADPSLTLATQVRKAQILNLEEKLDEAQAALTPFLVEKEENIPAYNELAIIKARQGQYDSALKIYTTITEIRPNGSAQPYMLSVYLHLKNKNPAKALELLKSLQIVTKGGELPTLTAICYLDLAQDGKLQTLFREQPDSLQAGLKAFIDQLEPDKEYIGQWALVNYFTIMRQPKYMAKAIEELHAKWPKNRLAISLWAGQLASKGKFAEAARLFETIPGLTFQQQTTLLGFYAKAKDKPKMVSLGQKLITEHPNVRGLNLFLADYYTAFGEKAKATEYYEKELALDPENVVCLNNLAWEFGVNQHDLAKATPYLDKLKAKKALDPRIMDTIGWILAKNGKNDEAMPYLHTALNIVPDHPGFEFHMAWLLSRMGKKEEAKKYLQSALASKLAFDDRKEAEKLLADQG